MNAYFFIKISYLIICGMLLVFSYGFVDRNLHLSENSFYTALHNPLQNLVYEQRMYAAIIYVILLLLLFVLYIKTLQLAKKELLTLGQIKTLILIVSLCSLFSFPAFSYDIFNYMATAKVTFQWKENPWIIMPIDIPNEPALAYTRAANKVALYGPTWVYLTSIPHYLGLGNVWGTILAFKFLTSLGYFFMIWLIYFQTKKIWNVVFFALNPLVFIEVILEGHNDIVMMVLCLVGLFLLEKKRIPHLITGILMLISSVLVKGATAIIFLLPFISKITFERKILFGYWLMFFIFLLTPFREELYPWYFVWCISFASFFYLKKREKIYIFTILLSLGLLLRNTVYIYTREYDGWNIVARRLWMIAPFVSYFFYYTVKPFFKKL